MKKIIHYLINPGRFNREIIGWSLRNDTGRSIVYEALWMALKRRKIDWAGFELAFHSDIGIQYKPEDTRPQLLQASIRTSVGKVACCFDNTVTESFFPTLEVECVQKQVYSTREASRAEVFTWIDGFYNRTRLHSTVGYLSPKQCWQHLYTWTGCKWQPRKLYWVWVLFVRNI